MIRIYRRPFNPSIEGAKSIRQLVARFEDSAHVEAEFCHQQLSGMSNSFKEMRPTHFSNYRYNLVKDQPKNLPPGQYDSDIRVDTSTAQKTGRPISFSLSWIIKHEQCEILAFTERYGAVRATIEDSPAARQHFVLCLAKVWPNAKIKK